MRCQSFVLLLLFLIPERVVARDPSTSASTAPPHFTAACEITDQIEATDTNYQHKPIIVSWKGASGAESYVCHADCSGFINRLLVHSYPTVNQESLQTWLGSKRPQAKHYYNAIKSEDRFQHITRIRDVQPGDVIAIKYPPGGENTGHVMLAAEPATARKASTPVIDGTEQWELPIIDSTRSGHGKSDSRHLGDGKYRDGLGRGVIRLYVSADETICGYTWSTSAVSKYRDIESNELAVGRIELARQTP